MTVKEGEERGICSATLKGLLRIVKDQVEEGSVAFIVLNKESTIWREASMKTLSHDAQLKLMLILKVVTNNRRIAEPVKNDRVEFVVMDGPKVVEDDAMDGPIVVRPGRVVENDVMDRLNSWETW